MQTASRRGLRLIRAALHFCGVASQFSDQTSCVWSVCQSGSCSVSPSFTRFVNNPTRTRTQTVTQKQRQTECSAGKGKVLLRQVLGERERERAASSTESSALWLLLYIDVHWLFFLLPPRSLSLSLFLPFDRKSRRNFANKTKSFNVYCRQLESLNNEPQFMSYIFGCGAVNAGGQGGSGRGIALLSLSLSCSAKGCQHN